jgi:Arc/MetJ-type ribon-helix-helix transcriptional regulator
MKLITLYLPETYIKLLDELVTERFYPNRAEAIRVSVRDLLSEHNRFGIVYSSEPVEHKQTAIERLEELQKNRINDVKTIGEGSK